MIAELSITITSAVRARHSREFRPGLSSAVGQCRVTVADPHQPGSDIVGMPAPAFAGKAFAQRSSDGGGQALAGKSRQLGRELMGLIVLDVEVHRWSLRMVDRYHSSTITARSPWHCSARSAAGAHHRDAPRCARARRTSSPVILRRPDHRCGDRGWLRYALQRGHGTWSHDRRSRHRQSVSRQPAVNGRSRERKTRNRPAGQRNQRRRRARKRLTPVV